MGNPPRTARGGFVSVKRLPKGPSGRALCRRCQTEVPAGRRTFCSSDCVTEWKIRTNPGFAAAMVGRRDKGMCAGCGIDCVVLLSDLELLAARETERVYGPGRGYVHHLLGFLEKLPGYWARCDELGLPKHLRSLTRRLWEMDHIIPVAEGGGSCGLENLRTLCWACHAKETAALAARRAEARRTG